MVHIHLAFLRAVVILIVHLYQETMLNRRGTGRPRVTNAREDRYLARYVHQNRTIVDLAVRTHLRKTFDPLIFSITIRRRHTRTICDQGPMLLPRYTAGHLQWAQEYRYCL